MGRASNPYPTIKEEIPVMVKWYNPTRPFLTAPTNQKVLRYPIDTNKATFISKLPKYNRKQNGGLREDIHNTI